MCYGLINVIIYAAMVAFTRDLSNCLVHRNKQIYNDNLTGVREIIQKHSVWGEFPQMWQYLRQGNGENVDVASIIFEIIVIIFMQLL